MNLSPPFTLAEFTASDTARREGIPNEPGPVEVARRQALALPERVGRARPGRASRPRQRANSCERSRKALNSSALPEGSRKNIVACSPTWPAKRM